MESRSQLYRYQRTGLLRSSLSRRPSAWGFLPLPPALGMGVLSSAAGPRPRASLLCRRPSAMALFSSFRVFKFSSFQIFKVSSFRITKFSSFQVLESSSLQVFVFSSFKFSSFRVSSFQVSAFPSVQVKNSICLGSIKDSSKKPSSVFP